MAGWERERIEFFETRGMDVREVGSEEREGGEIWEEIEKMERRLQEEKRWERIRKLRYIVWYSRVKEEGMPEYLKKGWGESRWRRVARYRLGNEMLEGRYWEEEGGKECRLCGRGRESWEHVWERCREWGEVGGGSWQEVYYRILGGEREGESWMREMEETRRERNRNGGSEGRRRKGRRMNEGE